MDSTREEILIGRVVDRCERPDDWPELEHLIARDPALLQQLCSSLRLDAAVRQAAAPALQVADRVELPPLPAPSRLPALAGWLAAVVIAALWLLRGAAPPPSPALPVHPVDAVAADLASDFVADGGAELGELPPLLVRSQPTEDGKALRVVTMRRILEVSTVQQVYRVGADEFGGVQQVPVALASCTTPSDF